MRRIGCPKGRVDVFLESVLPPPPLIVCGAGHDAIPLVHFAKELGWWVAVLDPRDNYATRERFPQADDILVASPEARAERTGSDLPLATRASQRDRGVS